MEENKMFLTIQLTNLSDRQKERAINDWLVFIRMMIEPSFFQSSHQVMQPFNLSKFQQVLQKEKEFEFGWFVMGDEENEFSLHFDGQQLVIKSILDKLEFFKHERVIRDYIKIKMSENGVFAYIRPYNEFMYHNIKNIKERLLFESAEEIQKLPKMKESTGEIVVDCNLFAGYDLSYKNLCFTSCWEMYYSRYYYRVIPKQVFLDVQQVEYVKEYDNEVIGIQLYRDPFKWKEQVNQNFQTYYRDQLGFDHLAWDNGVGPLKPPFIEYVYTNQSIQSVQYQNANMQPTQKKEASFFVTRSYNFINNEYSEKRVKGMLNTQAYFPWVDDQRAQMLCYKVLDPRISLDNGIEAYCYYIREYLEIAVEDDKYQEYLVTLRFYVPTEHLAQLPLREIQEELSDVKFKRFRKRRKGFSFDVKKGENHLRIEILDYPKLRQLATLQKI